MKKFPYFEIDQKGKKFLVTKMTADYLIDHVDFQFRFPYKNSEKDIEDADKYIEKLQKKTDDQINIKDRTDGIQRRTDLARIESIADHIEGSKSNTPIFPTPLVLGVNLYTEDEDGYKDTIIFNNKLDEEKKDMTISFPKDETRFTIIDGQHRMLGIARYKKKYDASISNIELPVILVPEIDLQDSTKIFIDINANQRKVNKSIVYDLYDNIIDEEYEYIKSIKAVVQALNENKSSVLKDQIKMLGTGQGSVSLAFMIEYIDTEIIKKNHSFNQSELLINLNAYFGVFKTTYPKLWETLFLKTTGMGALLMYYLIATNDFGEFSKTESKKLLENNLLKIDELKIGAGKDSLSIDLLSVSGTGKKAQKHVFEKINHKVI